MTQLLTNKDKFGKIDRMGRNYFALEFAEFLESDNFGGINDRKNFYICCGDFLYQGIRSDDAGNRIHERRFRQYH